METGLLTKELFTIIVEYAAQFIRNQFLTLLSGKSSQSYLKIKSF